MSSARETRLMQIMACRHHLSAPWRAIAWLLLCLTVFCLLTGCDPGGNPGSLSSQPVPSAPGEQQAVDNLLRLYREAVLAEDIDRVHALLQPTPALAQVAALPAAPQATDGTFADLAAFRQALSATFVMQAVTALELPTAEVVLASDRSSVTFLEVESTLDTASLTQATRVFRTTWQLARTETNGVVTFRIAAVRRPEPLVEVHTPGLLVAGPPQPLTVQARSAAFALAAVEVSGQGAGAMQRFEVAGTQVQGTFTASAGTVLHTLPVRALSRSGEVLVFAHRYRLHQVHEGIAQRASGTGTTRFFAVTVAPDGTVWAGGDTGGRLYQVAPESSAAQLVGALLADPTGRVEDLAVDQRGRLHAMVFAPQTSGDIVLEQGVFCQTVNVLDPAYPLRDPAGRPSPSTRVVPAADGAVWLLGSDGGAAQVSDTFRDGSCPAAGVTVQYDLVLRRQDGTLPTNTVPALVAGGGTGRYG
jgi:hypothetical protein